MAPIPVKVNGTPNWAATFERRRPTNMAEALESESSLPVLMSMPGRKNTREARAMEHLVRLSQSCYGLATESEFFRTCLTNVQKKEKCVGKSTVLRWTCARRDSLLEQIVPRSLPLKQEEPLGYYCTEKGQSSGSSCAPDAG